MALTLMIGILIATGEFEGLGAVLLVVVLVFGPLFYLLRRSDRGKQEKLTQTWSELARRTGLTVIPGGQSRLGNYYPPGIDGEYRSRRVTVDRMVMHHSAGESSVPVVYTRMAIQVNNPGGFSLNVGPRGIVLFKRRSSAGSGDEELDRRLRIEGSPPDFLRRVGQMMIRHRALLLERPQGLIMRTDNPLSWTSWSRPSIKLEGSELICLQSGVPTDVHHQMTMLNLLCDLAELAEGGPRRP